MNTQHDTPAANPEVHPATAPAPKVKGPEQPSSSVVGVEQDRESSASTREEAATTPSNGDGSKPKTVITAADVEASKERIRAEQREKIEQQKEINKAVADKVRFMSRTQKDAVEAQGYCDQLVAYFNIKNGVYLRDENSEYSVLVDGKRIAFNRQADNRAFNRVLRTICDITLSASITQPTIERLVDVIHDRVGKFKLRKFSATSQDGKRLYLPLKGDSSLLCITADKIATVPNGDNEDNFWVEKPHALVIDSEEGDGHSLDYVQADPKIGLAEFERLIVDTQACRVPEMAWLVAMHECLFPYVRGLVKDRFGLHHAGAQGNGKTTGAEMCATLHGLRIGANISAAVIRRVGDVGLLVYDNKESNNTTNAQKEDMIYIATGGVSARCAGNGGIQMSNTQRPVFVLTSIEGLDMKELVSRYIPVEYNAQERDTTLNNTRALTAIREKRHIMLAALTHVLQRFMRLHGEEREVPVVKEIKRFPDCFTVIVNLLRAYADVSARPERWTESIVEVWRKAISEERQESQGGDEVTFLCQSFLDARDNAGNPGSEEEHDFYLQKCLKNGKQVTLHKGKPGEQEGWLTPFVTNELLIWLRNKHRFNKELQKAPNQFAQRLRNIKGASFQIIDVNSGLPELKRGSDGTRRLGFFEPGKLKKPAAPMIPISTNEMNDVRKRAGLPALKAPAPPTNAKPPVSTVREVYQPEAESAKMN